MRVETAVIANKAGFSLRAVMQKIWQVFTSVKLALVLIFTLAALCLAGALILQAPNEVTADASLYKLWMENIASPKYGVWAGFLSILNLFDVFHSYWFLAAGGLLMLNIFACTVNRWKKVSLLVRGGRVEQQKSFFRDDFLGKYLQMESSADTLNPHILGAFIKRGYRVRTAKTNGIIGIAADKNRFATAGTLLTHISLVLFVLGFIIGSFGGFRDASVIVPENSSIELGHDTGLSLELLAFEDEYWENGSPKDYRSHVVLYENGQAVKQATLKVNSPLSYKGVNIYQSAFGPSVDMQVKTADGVITAQQVPFSQLSVDNGVQRDTGFFDLPELGLTVQLLDPGSNAADPAIGENQLGAVLYITETGEAMTSGLLDYNTPAQIGNIEFTATGREQYSVFQVSHNPGLTLIWIASALFVIGLCVVFYFPFRQAWVRMESERNGKSRLWIRFSGRHAGADSAEMNAVIEQFKNKI